MKKVMILPILFLSILCFSQQRINPKLFGFRLSTSFVFFDVEDTIFSNKVILLTPQILSFPGGLGNFYHFDGAAYGINLEEVEKYHKGSKPKIAKTLNSISKRKAHNNNYIYDFIELVKKANTKVIFNINIITEPTEDYIKALKLFSKNNIELLGVELGGELSNSVYKHIIDGNKYIELAKKCATEVRKEFPNIKISVVAAPINVLKRHDNWNNALSKETFYDAIVVHSYAKVTKGKSRFGQMTDETFEGEDKKEAFDLYKNRALNYFKDLYPKKIAEYNTAFKDKPIWITEWNLQMSKITANTLLQGLFAANYLLELCTNPKLQSIELTTFHNFAGRTLAGSMLMKKDNKTHVLSTYLPMKMMNVIFADSNFIGSKKMISKECFMFKFTNKETTKPIRYFVNWSDKIVTHTVKKDKIENWIKKEYFGNSLSSTTMDEKNKIQFLTQKTNNVSEISLKPFSFTLLQAGE